MNLPNANQQIVTAYEKCNLTVAEIAENYELDETAVKATLMASSPKFRKDLKAADNENLDVTQEEATEMLNIIKSIAQEQRRDMPGVALKAAQFIFNEGKGRNNIQGLNTSNLNVIIVNQKLQGMRAAREAVMEQIKSQKQQQNSITVESNVVTA